MLGIETVSDRQWQVVEGPGVALFRGTIRQCEDWLDFRDNNPTGVASSAAPPARCWKIIPSTLVWGATIVLGLYVLFLYQSQAGNAGVSPEVWPTDTRLGPPRATMTIVMAVHPQCPCSRASLTALNRVVAACPATSIEAHVLCFKPQDAPSGWEQTDLWRSAAAIPGVHPVTDVDGVEAARFGAATSGHVLLFDRYGTRLFSGGITAGRGHEGDNPGLESVIELVTGAAPRQCQAPVYGCSLRDCE